MTHAEFLHTHQHASRLIRDAHLEMLKGHYQIAHSLLDIAMQHLYTCEQYLLNKQSELN